MQIDALPQPLSLFWVNTPNVNCWLREYSQQLSRGCLPPSSLDCWPCQYFHREFKGLFWSPLPLPIFILYRGTACIWTCYISPPPQPDSLLLCSLRFTLRSSLDSLSPSIHLPPHPHLFFNLKCYIYYRGTQLTSVNLILLECSHSIISGHTVSLYMSYLTCRHRKSALLSNTKFNQCVIMRCRITGWSVWTLRVRAHTLSEYTAFGQSRKNDSKKLFSKKTSIIKSSSHWSLNLRRWWASIDVSPDIYSR